MSRPGDDLLSGTCLPLYQNRYARRRQPGKLREIRGEGGNERPEPGRERLGRRGVHVARLFAVGRLLVEEKRMAELDQVAVDEGVVVNGLAVDADAVLRSRI